MSKTVGIIWLVLLTSFIAATVQGDTVYFLVGEINPYYNDCYVLPLDEPSDIAHARDLITYGPEIGEYIVVARIYQLPPGSYSNINRNYLEPGLPHWSWEIDSFLGFADFTAEFLDGWPTWVEEDPLGWPSGSMIGFWSYTVIAEIGTDLEPWNCDLNIDGKINFKDFGMLASYWTQTNLRDIDIDGNGGIDINDLAIMADYWLVHFSRP